MHYPALSSGETPAVSRKDKFLLAGVAMVSAGAIAVTPVAQNATVIQQAKSLAYELTAVMDATASPTVIYGALANNTFTNLSGLGAALAANPAPLLSQVLENQLGYAAKFGAAFEAVPASLKTWYEGPKGKVMLEKAQAHLMAGEIGDAYEWFNHSMLYAFQGAFGPLIAPGFILSGIPRGGTEYLTGIPEQIAQNFTNLIGATFTSSVLVSGVFQGAFGAVSGTMFELSRVSEAFSTRVAAQDIQGAVNVLANTPGVLANAFLNGFDYADANEEGAGGVTEWPGLIRFAVPGQAGPGVKVVGGLLQSLFVDIPAKLAAAIDNTPEAASAAGLTVASAQRVAADLSGSAPAALPESAVEVTVVEVPKVEAPAVEAVKVHAPVAASLKVEAPAVEAVKVETPKAETAKVETPSVAAVPAATDEAAADSGSVSGSATGTSANADADGETKAKGKTKVTDRIKAKVSEAKEARQAKAKEAKEAKATAKEAKAKATKAKGAKGGDAGKSNESKGNSGSDS
ncbi:hypothetical protein [Mycolicibacterium lutetiense]|uniref:PE-PGRS family protein n=1 Tax=Mycolicibacterium lutetiense TaxID=1641992 RepID=A0ABS5A4Q9_9MYCO|nr:hypothetical protein [Mycolicibacterium lutetiense]MBP2455889.1 hypothetical protein [Mycolicibacterium lutetiense]